jgi:GT2 family glycosyltransferase
MQESNSEQSVPLVSVILVSRNNAAAVRRCLQALEKSQERELIDVSVVDNGSADDCAHMDTEFPNLRFHRLPRNFGMVKALNIALRTVTGEYVMFLDPAVEALPETISALRGRLEAAPDVVAACPIVVTPEGSTITRLHPIPLPGELSQACRDGDFSAWTLPPESSGAQEVDFVSPPVLVVRRAFLRGLNYLDERYGEHWWDLEICTQIRRVSRKIVLYPDVRVVIHAADPPLLSAGARGLLTADRALGAAVWVGKYYGAAQEWKFRLKLGLAASGRALVSLASFRDAEFRLAALWFLLSGRNLDGS